MYHVPNTQTLRHPSFKSVRSLLEQKGHSAPTLLEWIAEHNPSHTFFVFHNGTQLNELTWRQVRDGIHRAGHYFLKRIEGYNFTTARPVIALLAASDSITYWTSVMGIARANMAVFAISPRNAPDAIAHLLLKVQATALFVSSEAALQKNAKRALEFISTAEENPSSTAVTMHAMTTFEDLYPAHPKAEVEYIPAIEYDLDAPAFIFHSSGTTAYPKPVAWRYRDTMLWFRFPWFGDIDLAEERLGCHGLPVSHPMGSIAYCYAASAGSSVAVFRPQIPAVVPNSDNTLQAAFDSHCTVFYTVPTMLEQYSRDPTKVQMLKQMTGAAYGGGPLSHEVGDALAAAGVMIFNCYGATEAGGLSRYLPRNPGLDWAYFRVPGCIAHEFIPHGDGIYELIVFEDEDLQYRPMVCNCEHKGRQAYATGDLLVPHPTKNGYWTTYGRADEQIMLSTGEKTNPIPLENILNEDPHIGVAIMFGRGRFQNGVLIEPKPEFAFDPSDPKKLEEFRDMIWPTVERMNDYAPQHSRLFKEMILVASPSKPFTFTGKGSVRRPAILREYEPEIQECYNAIENLDSVETKSLDGLGEQQILDFVRRAVADVLKQTVKDDDDLFQFGCDSLQATWIRLEIIKALRAINPKLVKTISNNLVYEEPSIQHLASYLSNLLNTSQMSHKSRVNGESRTTTPDQLLAKIKQYTQHFPPRPAFLQPKPADGDVIFITGTTGGFGANILVQLLDDPRILKVFAFNRPKVNGPESQKKAFRARGLPEVVLESKKLELIEGDLSQGNFGLDRIKFAELRDNVTHILHNAWPVDFKRPLQSFEKSLHGVRNLVDFALSSPYTDPPRLLFVSSIGVFQHPKSREIAPELPLSDPSVPIGQGYTESKWVSEQILEIARKETGLSATSIRLGQISGNPNGYWNEREWFPAIVKSALYVKCLPDMPGLGPVSWIPAQNAATALIEMRNSTEPILHLVNPNPQPWRAYLEPIANELNVPLVPYNVWLSHLEATLTDDATEGEKVQQNPALHLMSMWRNADLGEDMEPPGIVRLDTTKARKVAPSLENVTLVPGELARTWVIAWRDSGFLPAVDEGANGVSENGVHGVNGSNGLSGNGMNGVNEQA